MVKRTFIFGLIWAVALVPPLAYLVVIEILYDMPNVGEVIMRRGDAEVYGLLSRFFSLRHITPAVAIAAALWVVSTAGLFWKAGFLDKEGLRFWRVLKACPATRACGPSGIAARLVSVVVLLLGAYGYYWAGMYFIDPESLCLFRSSFAGPYGTALFFGLLYFPAVLLAFSASTLAYAIASSSTLSEFRERASMTLTGLAVLGVSLFLLVQLKGFMDLDKGVKDIPGITLKAEPTLLVMLTNPRRAALFKGKFFDMNVTPLREAAVPYSEANENAVKGYLKDRGYFTGLRGTCYNFLTERRMMEFDKAGALELYKESLARTGDSGRGVIALYRVGSSPATAGYAHALEELADDTRYSTKGRCALRMGRAYAGFGDLVRANSCYNRGIMTTALKKDKDREFYVPPSEARWGVGRISGRVTVNGVPAEGFRVGLMRELQARMLAKRIDMKVRAVDPLQDLMGLMDGQGTAKDGRFSFDCIGEDGYVLLLSMDEPARMEMSAPGVRPVVVISRERPNVDVGTIALSFDTGKQGRQK